MTLPSRLKGRSGKVKPTMLLWIIVFGAVGYCGFVFGAVYWRKYQLESALGRDLSSAGQVADETIRQRVMQHVSAMNLPIRANGFRFTRTNAPRALRVEISYVETVNLVFTEIRIPVSVDFERPF
ncbi:hypothetical protein ACFL3B_04310 [Gemmatimonadota bacterium]